MIEKPDVPDDVILQALDEGYSIREAKIEFVPRGLDSEAWAYRVDADGQTYFLKVSRRTKDTIGAWMPLFLSRQGFEQVIPTLPAWSGEACAVVDGLMYRLQRFVPGSPRWIRVCPGWTQTLVRFSGHTYWQKGESLV